MIKLATAFLLVSFPLVAHAATPADAKAAVESATAAEDAAGRLGNRWIPAEASLKAAKAALATGKWDVAVAEASTARSLAERAIEQSHEQETAWRDAVIR